MAVHRLVWSPRVLAERQMRRNTAWSWTRRMTSCAWFLTPAWHRCPAGLRQRRFTGWHRDLMASAGARDRNARAIDRSLRRACVRIASLVLADRAAAGGACRTNIARL